LSTSIFCCSEEGKFVSISTEAPTIYRLMICLFSPLIVHLFKMEKIHIKN
jgi:hypothetical protein